MRFLPTGIEGVRLVVPEPHVDARGFFARTWCAREFAAAGLPDRLAQCSLSRSEHAGTIRGLHFQRPPHAEEKLVRCSAGALFDVVLDLRPGSPSFRRWQGFELTAASSRALFVPKGVAHGFQTLVPGTEAFYQITEEYAPEAAAGVRFDDPALAIPWPLPPVALSERDRALPTLEEALASGPAA